uniref:CCHC-type domain-containing protein n=1 Tax=Arion vulgaris TaxID=1028688 RepID=A0A0B7A2N9_9EUPU
MAAKRANIDLVALPKDAMSPLCPHGPTLLFERIDLTSKCPRQFYACSAFRDRKACSFFQWTDQTTNKSAFSTRSPTIEPYSHKSLRARYFQLKKLSRNQRHVCCTCGLLLLEEELSYHKSQGHSLKHGVRLQELKYPSSLFSALDDNKTYAQYLFSKTTVNFLIDTLTGLGYTHILCVGAPRIHEEIQMRRKSGVKVTSLLLDLDERYAQVYPPSLFIKYNMFNHHFFEDKSKSKLTKFLSGGRENVALITDPPFGGMVEALAATFKKISQMWNVACTIDSPNVEENVKDRQIPMVWVFPYFMESRILSQVPEMSMLDYKVDYENHILYNSQHKKKGSPVRIFTNIAQTLFVLPLDSGYWFCQQCQRYSSSENWHCRDCGTCTSKDGTRYVHCDACMRCVKPSRVHCFTCQMCQLKDHKCGQINSSGCHICGKLDHKRRECPQRMHADTDNNSLHKRTHKKTMESHGDKHCKKVRRK